MKNIALNTQNINTQTFDMELLMILNRDLKIQKEKQNQKMIHQLTSAYDQKLLELIKADVAIIHSNFMKPKFAQAS
ncbi:MAG: hypothetical protein IE931_13635 [Sphingobacteriales bacterium]|nr:hypothetical protein [Sphingobacteriales bacterium]